MRNAKFLKRHINAGLVLPILLVITLGCLGPGNKVYNCEGIVKAGGSTFRGLDDKKEQAGLNACNKFCMEKDAEFDSMYRIWLDSPAGKRVMERRKKKPTKEESIFENKRLLDYVTKNCAKRCVKDANKGMHTIEVNCKK